MTSILLLAGCSSETTTQNQENTEPSTIEQPLINPNDPAARFENDQFSLSLPGPVDKTVTTGIIPLKESDFERIVFAVGPKEGEKTVLETEADRNALLCTETDVCPVMANSVDVTIDGAEGIKYETNSLGRSQDDPEGETYGFVYALVKDDQLYRFWTQTTDLGDPERTQKVLDEALATLKFKEV